MPRPIHEIRFSSLTRIVRRRLLSKPGEVLVRVGDRVDADDVVAETTLEGQLWTVDVAGQLGISATQLPRHLSVAKEQSVGRGAELASRRLLGIPLKKVHAPCDGVVRGIHDGRVFIRQEPQTIELKAYIPGQVIEHFPHRGVSIQTTGSLIRGIWGSGPERQGVLVTSATRPQDQLTWQQVGIRYRGTILVGGTLQDPRVLYRARQFRVHGLVVGSMRADLRPVCSRLGLTIVVTEGMGDIPMAEAIFGLLRAEHGGTAIIAGADDGEGSGPELIVPKGEGEEALHLPAIRPLEAGMHVRLTRPPYLGTIARIESLTDALQETVIGTQAEGAHVRLPDGKRIFVPYVNMEPLE